MEEILSTENSIKAKKWTLIVKPIIFFALVISIFFALSFTFGIIGDTRLARIHGYRVENADSLDIIALGDSITYCGYAPAVMYKEYGYTSYNCGQSNQNISETYEVLEDVLKYHKPELVMIEAGVLYSHRVPNKKKDKLKETFGAVSLHKNWKNLGDFIKSKGKPLCDNSTKGYVFTKAVKPCTNPSTYLEDNNKCYNSNIKKANLDNLQKIINLCNENDIELLLIKIPSTCDWSDKRHQAVQLEADRLGLTLLDLNYLNDSTGLSLATDSKDYGPHLNVHGAIKITRYLAHYINDNYTIVHKNKEDKNDWQKAVNKFYNDL